MSPRARLLLSFAMLAVAIWVLWEPFDGRIDSSQDLPESTQAVQPDSASASSSDSLIQAGDENSPLPRQAVDPRKATDVRFGWQGVILDAAGQPLADARVFRYDPWTYYDDPPPEAMVRSGSDGRWFLPWPQDLEWYSQGDMMLRGGDGSWRSPRLPMPPPSSPPAELELQLLAPRNHVVVTLLDKLHQRPMAKREIHLVGPDWFSMGVTDDRGVARLACGGPESVELRLGPDDPGDLEGPWPLQVPTDGELHLTVWYVGPPAQLRLQAVSAATELPIAPATFRGLDRYGGPTGLVHVAAEGVLEWQSADPRNGIHLMVEAKDHLPTRVVVRSSTMENPLPVPLLPAQQVEFTVRTLRSGEPVAARVMLALPGPSLELHDPERGPYFEERSWSGDIETDALTGKDGVARLSLLTDARQFPEVVEISVATEESTETVNFGRLATAALGPMPWILELEPASGEVVFHLVDPDGKPVAEEFVMLWYQPGPDAPLPWRAKHVEHPERHITFRRRDFFGRTDASGELRVKIPAGVAFVWRGGRDSITHQESALAPGEVRHVEDQRLGSHSLSGVILTADGTPWSGPGLTLLLVQADGTPPPGFEHEPWYRQPRWARVSIQNTDGHFRFEEVPSGSWRIEALNMPLADGQQRVFVAGTEGIELRLQPLNLVWVRVVDDESGLPIPGEGDFHVFDPDGFWYWSTLWDGRGSVRFPSFGETWVEVVYDGYQPTVQSIGNWPVAGEEREVELRVKRGRRVSIDIAEGASKGFSRLIFPDFGLDDPRQNRLRWGGSPGVWLLNGVSYEAFELQPVDQDGNAIGPRIVVPAGSEEIRLPWPPPDAAAADGGN